jgi:hypothetical protein
MNKLAPKLLYNNQSWIYKVWKYCTNSYPLHRTLETTFNVFQFNVFFHLTFSSMYTAQFWNSTSYTSSSWMKWQNNVTWSAQEYKKESWTVTGQNDINITVACGDFKWSPIQAEPITNVTTIGMRPFQVVTYPSINHKQCCCYMEQHERLTIEWRGFFHLPSEPFHTTAATSVMTVDGWVTI